METLETLAFKTEKQAYKNLQEINSYFKSRLIDSKVFRGTYRDWETWKLY